MIDGSVLQSAQRCFEKKSRVVVKMVVKCFKEFHFPEILGAFSLKFDPRLFTSVVLLPDEFIFYHSISNIPQYNIQMNVVKRNKTKAQLCLLNNGNCALKILCDKDLTFSCL